MNSSTVSIPATSIPYTAQERSILNARTAKIRHFRQVPWQYFSTHTFARPVSQQDEHPMRLWKDYLDEIGEHHRDTLGYLWSIERRGPHSEYAPIRPHFHALWVSPRSLDTGMMEETWKGVAGNGGNPVLIEPFSRADSGLEYVLKMADHSDCHWDFSSNLSFFMPGPVDVSTARARRRLCRHRSRVQKAQCNASVELPDSQMS